MAGRASSPRLVGRDSELARLRGAAADAAAGRFRFVLVSGDAGIGKSRLIGELASVLRPGTHVLVGGCLAIGDGGLPYAPLAEILRRLAREVDPTTLVAILGPARMELARLVPELGGAADTDARPSGSDARAGRARLFELVLGLLDRLGSDRPAVLVVEDVHWADDATRALLTYLVANLRTERVAIVATDRTDDPAPDGLTGPWLADIMRGPGCERIDLRPLTPADVSDQVREIRGAPARPDVVADIAVRSGGNALFVEELVAAGAGGPDRAGQPDGAAPVLPDTLREMLASRLRALPPDTTAVVRALAVAGRAIDDRVLVAVTGLTAAATHDAIRDATRRHLVDVEPGTGLVDLHHQLLREAVAADLLGGERRVLHAAFAAAFVAEPDLADASPAGAAGELATHWAAADRPIEAFRAAINAADASLAVHAYADAARHRRRALDLLPRLPAGVRRRAPHEIDLLLDAEEAANLASDFTAAVELIERGLALVDPAADSTRAGILESRLGYHRWLAGRSEEAVAHHRRAVVLVPAEPPSLARARVMRGLGGALMGLGQYRESATVCQAAIEAARAGASPAEEGRALGMLGMDRFGLGDVDGGIAALEAACALARRHDPGEGLIVGLHNLSYHLALADRAEEALAAALEGIAAARRDGLDRRYGLNLRAAAADVLLRLGRWDEADRLVAEGRSLDPDGDGPLYLVIVRMRLATARGRYEDARAALAVGDRMATGDVDFDLVAYLRTAEAELDCWTGRPDLAVAAVDAGLEALTDSDDVFLAAPLLALGARAAADRVATARAWRDEPSFAAARGRVAAMRARLDALADPGAGRTPPATRGLAATLAWARAECDRVEGAADPSAWHALAATWTEMAMPALAAYARWRSAEATLAARGSRIAAAADLAASAAEAARLGAAPLGEEVAALARRARIAIGPSTTPEAGGVTPAPAPVPGVHDGRGRLRELGLSSRELEILELLASGRTNAEIGGALFISPKTASVHASHIFDKLGVSGRVEAAAVAMRLGLVDPGPRALPDREQAPVARTFLFTDMVASTALIDVIGDAAWMDLRAWHDAALRRLFAAHGGIEVDHAGDGFFVAFPSPAPAVACAVAIQRALAEHRRAAGFAPGVRIGLHHGEATRTGAGWSGREVHLAARLAARAGSEEIVATTATMSAAGLTPAGAAEVMLPGIAAPVEVALVPWH